MQLGIVIALLLLIAAVKWWPIRSAANTEQIFTARVQETIEIDEIQPTRQIRRSPPPPAPLPPIIVPDDIILDDVVLEFTDALEPATDPGEDLEKLEGDTEGTPTALAHVESGPKPVRIVEPEYTREARRKRVKAEIVVEVLVDERGRVAQANVIERYLVGDDNEPKEAVTTLGYGLEESAISAAERWLFRPARKNGSTVKSYTTLTLSFGV